jgi:triosephosphate isomerase
MKKLIVGNWKMHFNPAEASVLVHRLNQKIFAVPSVQVVLCPAAVNLFPVAQGIDDQKFKLGAQNIHYRDEGPFTGEISAVMVKGLANYAIVGHSERRQHFHEDDKLVAEKLAAAVRHKLKPILCVGENLLDRQHGLTKKVVTDQLEAGLAMLTAEDMPGLAVAYEPVWAIGTGDFARPDDVWPVASAIRMTIEELYGESAAGRVKVLYGGSVEPDNARAYLRLENIDGLLVGGASIHYEKFAAIVQAAQDLAQE